MTLARHDLTPRQPELWPQFVAALHAADLPAEDLAEPGQSFFAFRDAGGPVGFGGYLLAGGDALLRSIVVLPPRRRRGLGSEILSQLLAGVGAAGARAAWLLTMDADGMYVYERNGLQRRFPTRARTLTDVTGAGDMVLSILGLVIAAKGSLADAVSLANIAAGLEIRRLGVTPLSREEIRHEILTKGRPGSGKIRSIE